MAENVNLVLLEDSLRPAKFQDTMFADFDRFRLQRQAKDIFNSILQQLLFEKPRDESLPKKMRKEETIAALGSTERIYSLGNCSFFSTVLAAYNNHWKLRSSPDDWWFCVIKRVACAIKKNANKESVRKMFVDHEAGKETIIVKVPDRSIYTVDYSWLFDQMAKGIQENVKVPEFVDRITADFSTTTAVQKIVSQITLMHSVQEYFHFKVMTLCGIPALEMLGTKDDWKKLKSKFSDLRSMLEPIKNDLGLRPTWLDLVEKVFDEVLSCYEGQPNKTWWAHIMSKEEAFRSGEVDKFNGWMIEFLEGTDNSWIQIDDMTLGLVSVPLILEDPLRNIQDTATLIAGMQGFTIHTSDTAEVSVQPFQGWSLLLAKDSPLVN